VFVAGVLMLVLALAMVVAGFVVPVDAARPGLFGGAFGVGIAGAIMAYLGAPARRTPPPPGMLRAKATILDAATTAGAVAGYPMVEVTLEVQPKDGLPFHVKRKFSSGRLGRIEQGRRIDVLYDPMNPKKVELA
jgi:hypothetical protein